MPIVPQRSKRIRAFEQGLIKGIPRFPNNRETLNLLESKSLGSLMIIYLNWMSRYVPPRPRSVHIETSVTSDPRWKLLSADTKLLFDKARNGHDLSPHLSLKVRREGFSPNKAGLDNVVSRWEDKDFLLNAMGYHHFHLSHIPENNGHNKRTDVMLFAELTREKFTAVGFFDHDVFESSQEPSKSMTAERERLWNIFDQRSARGAKPGSVYINVAITTSGHCLHHTSLAAHYARTICEIDPKIDDPEFVGKQFGIENIEVARTLKPIWFLNYLDLGLYEKKLNTFVLYGRGTI
jgi:hypothetical protein